jgi:hypothetical protein
MEIELMTEATTPMEEAATATEEVAETETTPQGSEEAASEEATTAATEEAPAEAGLSIRYNKEDVTLTTDEAKRLAQIGMHYEKSTKAMLDSLDYVATIQGKSVKELVESLVSGVDQAYREELVSELGEDNPIVEELLENRRAKNNKAYEDAKAERTAREKAAEEEAQKSASTKLAEQFEAVRELFPEYDTVEKVPDTVIKRALKSGDLEKEMLRYQLTEAKKVEAAKATSEKNKKENIGSMASDTAEDGVSSAFMKGLWG